MQRILAKRVLRDLRENLFRYLALGILIILSMYLIVSLAGAAETIMTGVEKHAGDNQLEDGEFGTFLPLSDTQETELLDSGITLERMFYVDFKLEDGSTIRVFQNREAINLTEIEEGKSAAAEGEVVLEKRYCEEHGITVGDSVTIAGRDYTVTGIGTTPDYDAPYRSLSDSTVDSTQFGTAFVTKEAYKTLVATEKSEKSEQCQYAYHLNGAMTDDELQEKLQEYKVDVEDIDDPYFTDYWNRTIGQMEDFKSGVNELYDGSGELQDALSELSKHNDTLSDGAAQIFDAFLEEANSGLSDYGLATALTEDNFEEELNALKERSDNAILGLKLNSITEELKMLKAYKDGVTSYTDGVGQTADGAGELRDGMKELKDATTELLEEYGELELDNLTEFMVAKENPRVNASANDQIINKWASLMAGVIILILFTYVISVFVVHGIERESSIIGTLYAMGATEHDLMLHYLLLPVLVTFVAGLIGTVLGFSSFGLDAQTQDCYGYYSIPQLADVYPMYLIVYGVIMPPLAATIVNLLVIRKKLRQPALALIRNEQKRSRISNVDLGNMGFIGRFRIRQMLREVRSAFALLFGMFISLWILMMGVDCYVMCDHISDDNKADTKYAYMYTYKYPDEQVADGGEACYAKTLKKEIYGYNLDVTVLGIDDYNPYFDAKVTAGKNSVVISSAMAEKYHLKTGDEIILSDDEVDMDYAFEVTGITQFSTGFYAFMDIDSMWELFGVGEDYYNVVFADHKLDIDSGKLYAVTSKTDIEAASDVFTNRMAPMVTMMIVVAALIFAIVMYLMMKVMIDRSAFSISVIKIFGFRTGEIRKLYLNGNFYIVAIGGAVLIPLAKKVMDEFYPFCVANVACGMNLTFGWKLYAGIYVGILLLYLLINQLLVARLKKLVPAEVLKNRE